MCFLILTDLKQKKKVNLESNLNENERRSFRSTEERRGEKGRTTFIPHRLPLLCPLTRFRWAVEVAAFEFECKAFQIIGSHSLKSKFPFSPTGKTLMLQLDEIAGILLGVLQPMFFNHLDDFVGFCRVEQLVPSIAE